MLLLTANVAALAFRERVPELAAMKALGFKDGTVALVVLAEALALCLLGAVSGVAIGLALESPLNAQGRRRARPRDRSRAGLVIGLPPPVAARRLSILRALREIR